MRGQTSMPFISISICFWSKVFLNQICQREGLLMSRHFEEVSLLAAFYHELKHFVQFLKIELTE